MTNKCNNAKCENEFEDNSYNKTRKYCSKKCSKAAEYLRNKNTYVKYESRNRDRISDRANKYYHVNKETINSRRKELYLDNPEIVKARVNKYRNNNLEMISKKKSEYGKNNRTKINQYVDNKLKNDELYKLRHYLRTRLRLFLKRRGYDKEASTSKLLGCSFEELKEYLEKQFTIEMTWTNYGSYWHIDHIRPLASAKTNEDLYLLCNYKNLQPLEAKENLSKGAKIIN